MKTRYVMGLLVVAFVAWMLIARFVHVAKISVKVVDEEERPIEGAKIELCFYGGCLTKDATKGSTNKDGSFSSLGSSRDGVTGGVVKKEGYYNSVFHHDFFIKSSGVWKPWNKQIKVVLRPVVKPVPMYVRNRSFQFPAINKDLGFDLMKADWVPPYGAGVHRDFIFRVERIYKDSDNFDATLTITFPNKYDGIRLIKDNRGGDFSVGSRFQLPRIAPEEGYQPKMMKRVSSGIYGSRAAKEDDNNYIFRVRSESESGKLKRAMFGKILGDIRFGPIGGNGGFEMHYYLNPDYTRNLEFDPKKNLFTNSPEVEGVGLP
ncbi:hypothetical protein [Geobacter sp.]|uniref:hypothetical protein n=1 Tax=Geobacter sp. TaxID=46610 RepID=UPI002617C9CC|nr:hypothetical protein [Geobacter sp.]